MGRHQCSAVTTAIEIAPVCEEILKLLPLLLYFLIFEPDSHKLTPAAIGIAVGFATFENVWLPDRKRCRKFCFPAHPRHVRRGPASGLRHPDRSGTGLCVPPSVAHLAPARWGFWGSAWCCTGIYNLLITADGFWQMVGYFFPSAIIVTLFAAKLLHRGRHTVFR